tara:strand:- start:314 stop:751 length:438 start_codon:yes stop_codon:yes gene_type:complete
MTVRFTTRLDYLIGTMVMVIADGALEFLEFEDDRQRHQWFTARHYPEGLPPVRRDETGISEGLAAYFRGDLRALDALPARPRGTEFQQTVWSELRRIPAERPRPTAHSLRASVGPRPYVRPNLPTVATQFRWSSRVIGSSNPVGL